MKLKFLISNNKHIFGVVIATIILSSLVGTSIISDSFALKAKGKSSWKYGSATSGIVCGDRLCSDIPNGETESPLSIKLPVQQDDTTKVNCSEGKILIQGTHCAQYEISGTFVTGAYVDTKFNSIIIEVDPYNDVL